MPLLAPATVYNLAVTFIIYNDSYLRGVNNMTRRAFYLRNLHGATQEEQVAHAAQVIDEVAAELRHLTKFGIASAVIKAGTRKVHEQPYPYLKPVGPHHYFKDAVKIHFSTTYYYTWAKGNEQRLWLPEAELGQGWEPQAVRSSLPRKESFRLPAYTAASHGGSLSSHADFFFHKVVQYKKRKTRSFRVTCDRNDPVFVRFIGRFYENGHLCFGDPRSFAAPGGAVEMSGSPWPRSQSKPKKQLRHSVLAGQPFDETDYVYIIRMGRTNYYKIGKSNDPQARLQSLQTATPYRLQLVHTFAADNATAAEEVLHRLLHGQRSEGEWFRLTPAQRDALLAIEAFSSGYFQIQGKAAVPDALF